MMAHDEAPPLEDSATGEPDLFSVLNYPAWLNSPNDFVMSDRISQEKKDDGTMDGAAVDEPTGPRVDSRADPEATSTGPNTERSNTLGITELKDSSPEIANPTSIDDVVAPASVNKGRLTRKHGMFFALSRGRQTSANSLPHAEGVREHTVPEAVQPRVSPALGSPIRLRSPAHKAASPKSGGFNSSSVDEGNASSAVGYGAFRALHDAVVRGSGRKKAYKGRPLGWRADIHGKSTGVLSDRVQVVPGLTKTPSLPGMLVHKDTPFDVHASGSAQQDGKHKAGDEIPQTQHPAAKITSGHRPRTRAYDNKEREQAAQGKLKTKIAKKKAIASKIAKTGLRRSARNLPSEAKIAMKTAITRKIDKTGSRRSARSQPREAKRGQKKTGEAAEPVPKKVMVVIEGKVDRKQYESFE